ncbi:MAG: hypothetical protein U0787_06825 [Polyangia bacterium]
MAASAVEIRAEPPVLTLPGLLSEVAHSPLLHPLRRVAADNPYAPAAPSMIHADDVGCRSTSDRTAAVQQTPKRRRSGCVSFVARAQVALSSMKRAQADTQLQKQQLPTCDGASLCAVSFSPSITAVKEENQKILQVIVASVDGRYRVGRAELAELLDAQAALHEQNTELIELGHRSKQAESDILALLGRLPHGVYGRPRFDS